MTINLVRNWDKQNKAKGDKTLDYPNPVQRMKAE